MGAGIYDTVLRDVVKQIIVCCANVVGIKAELQHFHIGVIRIPNHLSDRIGHIAQILNNDGFVAHVLPHLSEQRHAGPLFPMA